MNILTTYSERLGTEIEDPQLKEAVEKFAEDYLFKSFDGLEASGESILSQMARLEKYNLINTKNYKELREALRLFKEKKENYEMINKSHYCIIYYNEPNAPTTRKSGTKIALDYAINHKKENERVRTKKARNNRECSRTRSIFFVRRFKGG